MFGNTPLFVMAGTYIYNHFRNILRLFRYFSSVKWGHLGHFDLEPNFPTNPMGSSGPLWARLYNNNYKNQNKN